MKKLTLPIPSTCPSAFRRLLERKLEFLHCDTSCYCVVHSVQTQYVHIATPVALIIPTDVSSDMTEVNLVAFSSI